jgi:hypothetical protein
MKECLEAAAYIVFPDKKEYMFYKINISRFSAG